MIGRIDESAAVLPDGDETLTNAAVRSAIVMAHTEAGLTTWTGRSEG